MSLFSRVYQAVQEWRQRRGTSKSRKRSVPNMEPLDQRQLLAVNFTGVVLNDFPVGAPGIAYLTDPNNQTPIIAPPAAVPIVGESGLQIDQIAVNYDSTSDTLSIGLLGPLSTVGSNIGQRVIAGDVDNNGNNSTTSAAAAAQGFFDAPGISDTESMGAFVDLSGGTSPLTETVVAGTPEGTTSPPQTYEVAQASFTGNDINARPTFGTQFTNNTGSFSLINDPAHGGYELSISHFSQLYQAETGHPLAATSVINIGGFGASADDGGTSEEFFHFQPATISNITTPIPPPPVPPPPVPPVPPVPPPPPPPVICSPTILVNPHENRHVNTAHQNNIRVTVLSSSGFDATTIDPNTVRFGGAAPIAEFSRIQLHDGIESETFVFKGTDITLPPGFTEATISGVTTSGMVFSSSELIFNRDDSFYKPGQISARDARLARLGLTVAQEVAASGATATPAVASAVYGQTVALGTPTGQGVLTIAPVVPITPTTVKITPRQAAVDRATARKDALLSTAAASPFRRSAVAVKAAPIQAAPATPSSSVHDAALADLGAQTGQ